MLNGTLLMELSHGSVPNSDKLVLTSGTLTFGGILTVLNSGGALVAGDVFDLFDASAFAGAFSATNLPALDTGLVWDTSMLAVDGTLRVAPEAVVPPEVVYGPVISGGDFVVRFAGTPGFTYTIQGTESLTTPNWQKVINLTAPTMDQGYGLGVFEFTIPVGTGARYFRTVYPSY
jgi:hypothetical protein